MFCDVFGGIAQLDNIAVGEHFSVVHWLVSNKDLLALFDTIVDEPGFSFHHGLTALRSRP